jgi:hypothetical protein
MSNSLELYGLAISLYISLICPVVNSQWFATQVALNRKGAVTCLPSVENNRSSLPVNCA